ncbi:MAG TPA: hypothetical protein VFV50_06660, partial [Bdellovibrionales bacterium]|nr:hypothetical protein [Bdellovibrionales bacterium]
ESIFLDPVHPYDFLYRNVPFCCEQCSHFDPENKRCTIGYNAKNHLREKQLKAYELTGRMALCRTLEID